MARTCRRFHLTPLAGRGRRQAAGEGAMRHDERCDSDKEPLIPTLSPQKRGEGEGEPC
jgi:hypothetical protein